ncbi:MAG TPA: ABC transporter permease [Vicinamibacterales bacterium]|nr:ABC transporter permease [Vicinamibacterales bacterium]
MIFRDTIDLALRNLAQAKLRTSLTTLGVAIGIASLAGMVSLGVGLQDQFVDRFTRSGMFDSVTVLPGQANLGPGAMARVGRFGRHGFGGGRRGVQPSAPDVPPKELTDDTLKELAALDGVRDVYPNLRAPVEVKYGGESEYAIVAGIPMSLRGEGVFQSIPYGTFFTNESENVCLLSLDFAKRINEQNPGSLVGRNLTLVSPSLVNGAPQRSELKFRIIGIVERDSGPFAGVGGASGVMIPLARAKEISASSVATIQTMLRNPSGARTYPSAIVKVARARATQDVEERVKKLGFSAFSMNDAIQGAKRAFIILDIVLSLIGSIALAVSSLGIMNTMVMSILERTREIGIMKAIGGSNGDVRRIFLIEASAIGLLGGIAGVMLGWAVGRAINFGANVYIQQQGGTPANLFSLPFWLIGGAIGFSIVISLMAGSYPAARAARLDPIQALRHD